VQEAIPYVWQQLQPMIDRALSHGDGDSTTSGHMLAKVLVGQRQLWAIHEGPEIIAGLVISIRTYAAKKTVVIELAAGRDLDRWAEQLEGILRDFRDLAGANTIECSCRAGLARRLLKRGWISKATIMELK
jgi:ABC-type uncharacterized transport system ATPase subunit